LYNILKSTDTKIIFTYDGLYKTRQEYIKRAGVKTVLCTASEFMRGALKLTAALATKKRFGGETAFKETQKDYIFDAPEAGAHDKAVYIHSGGTTGEPKTVVHSNYAFNAIADAVIATVYENIPIYLPTDSMLMTLPIFHSFGLGVSVHTLLTNAHIVMLPQFRTAAAIKLIKKHKITHLTGVPAMYRKMLEHRTFKGDLSSLKHIFCGGDKLSPDLKVRFDAALKKYGSDAELLEGYGLTEVGGVFSLSLNGLTRPRSQGKALIGSKVRVLKENGEDAAYGEEGEFWLATPAMMLGYLNDQTTTNEVIKEYDGVKWFKTGDVGKIDEDGYIYFCERAKRSLKIAGMNIFPSAVEEVINTISGIRESCVARMNKNGKAFTRAYVVLDKKTDEKLVAAKIKREVAARLIRYAVPKEIIFTDKLHRTPHAKIDYMRYENQPDDACN
ncbi:MAG: fatty acid--CoA ligase family protein, partial [Clostridia bacterium]